MSDSERIAALEERVAALERENAEWRDRVSAIDEEKLIRAVMDIICKSAREYVPMSFM